MHKKIQICYKKGQKGFDLLVNLESVDSFKFQ